MIYYHPIPDCVYRNTELTPTDKMLLILLVDMNSHMKELFPSEQKLGELMGLTRQTISNSLNKMKGMGLLATAPYPNSPKRRIILNYSGINKFFGENICAVPLCKEPVKTSSKICTEDRLKEDKEKIKKMFG